MMAASDVQMIVDILAGTKGVLGLLLLILIGSFWEVWVWGKAHRRVVGALERERDRWQTLALSTTSLAREALITQAPRDGA
jgi:hypothetical protein